VSIYGSSCFSTKTIWNTLRGTVVSGAVHAATGGIAGAVGAAMLSSENCSPAEIAKVGAIGGVLMGSVAGSIRGFAGRHFEPHNIETACEALCELGLGVGLFNIGGAAGVGMAGSADLSGGESAAAFGLGSLVICGAIILLGAGKVLWNRSSCPSLFGNSSADREPANNASMVYLPSIIARL
jgi:hypothetical protein